jgi:DNA-binding CsgD family transcriptional regulator
MNSGFRPDQEAQIAEQYGQGATPSELARAWNCTLDAINRALDNTNTIRRKRGGSHPGGGWRPGPEIRAAIEARNAEILRLHAEGKTTTEIMAMVGLQRAAVCKVLRAVRGPRTITSDEEIVALRQSGATLNAITRETGTRHERVVRVLTAGGLIDAPTAPRRPDLTARNAEILRRRRAGENPKAIAADLGLAVGTVYVVLEGADDLPPLRKGGGNALPRKGEPPATTEPRPAPVLLPRPPAQRRPAIRRAEGTVTATRTCHSCEIQIPVNDWADHLTKVHGYKGAAGLARTALDRYLERIRQQPEVEPQRQPDPPCPVCGLSPCPTPIVHARTARTWAQRGYQPRKKGAA